LQKPSREREPHSHARVHRVFRPRSSKSSVRFCQNQLGRRSRIDEARCLFTLYLASLFGVTGTRRHLDKNLPRLVRRTRRLADKLPVCVGFGISTPTHVATVLKAGANGAIVGSALVEIVARNSNRKDLPELVARSVRELKAATHQS
jgi:tryptophan synthase alpha subunit